VTAVVPRVSPHWLALREPADARARAVELVEPLRQRLAARPVAAGHPAARHLAAGHLSAPQLGAPRPGAPPGPVVVHDLGAGTGSMLRWLAPRLPGAQHWILHDRDPDLLDRALAGPPVAAADGAPVTVAARLGDLTRLTVADLAGAGLVTASALLDVLTAGEVERLVAACAGYPTLLGISVTGRVELTPPHPLDATIAEAFNAHQRRTVDGLRLLGPDAVGVAAAAFRRRGVALRVRSSPWRLGPDQPELAVAWCRGWLDAACEQRPELVRAAAGYARRRLADAAAGRLSVVVHHRDLLAGCD
jgi:hypothetical protein